MQQVLIIHGGDCFNTYEEYLEFLKNFPLDLESLKSHPSWKHGWQEKLGSDFEVLNPRMPNPTNAQYDEWKIWFEKMLPLINDNPILIGHSLGGIFLAKYLSQNKIDKKIKATMLIAAPFEDIEGEPIASFNLPSSLKKCEEQAGQIYLFHSEDDQVVPFSHLAKYQAKLPSAKVQIFKGRQHFNQEEFSEIVQLIKSL